MPRAGADAVWSKPPPPSCWSGESPPVSSLLSRLERQAVGDPAGRLADGVDDVVADPGVDLRRRVADRAAGEQDQEQGDERRPRRPRREPCSGAARARSKRLISLSSRCSVKAPARSELEVDEGWHALARDGRADEQDHGREPDREQHRAQALDPQLERARAAAAAAAAGRSRRSTASTTGTVQRVAGPRSTHRPRKRPEDVEVGRAEQDPAEADEVEGAEPAQPDRRARPIRPSSACSVHSIGARGRRPRARTSTPRRARGRRGPS